MRTHKIVAANTLSQFIGRIVSTGATFAVSILVISRFGILTYGDFIKITTFIAPFYLLVDFGLNAIYVQKAKDDHVENYFSWYSLLLLRMCASIILMILAISILAFLPIQTSDGYTNLVRFGIILFSPTIFFHGVLVSANALFQKQLAYHYSTIALCIGATATLLGIFVVTMIISPQAGAIFAALAFSGGLFVSAFVSFLFARQLQLHSPNTIQKSHIIVLLKQGLPLGITLVFNLIYFRIDSFILALTRPTAEVGVYGFVYKIFEAAIVFPMFFMNSLYPLLLTREQSNLKRILFYAGGVLLSVSLIGLFLLWFGAQYLSRIDVEFTGGIVAMRVLGLGLPLFYLSSLTLWILIVLGKRWVLALIYGVSMIGNIIANVLLIPRHGYLAAAWITVVSEAFVLIATSLVVARLFPGSKSVTIASGQSPNREF